MSVLSGEAVCEAQDLSLESSQFQSLTKAPKPLVGALRVGHIFRNKWS